MLMTGPLEPTNEWYAIAKIAGMKLAEACRRQDGLDFISAMPTNLYGPQDNFDLNSSHVIPALIRKAHEAKGRGDKELIIWGTGTPLREFLHVDDCADALVLLLKTYSDALHVNVGSGEDISIGDLARQVANVVGFEGEISFDRTKPDGMPRKLMSADRLKAMGWRPRITLAEGLAHTYSCFLRNGAECLPERLEQLNAGLPTIG
jgi:GDP-L-fucose synthase